MSRERQPIATAMMGVFGDGTEKELLRPNCSAAVSVQVRFCRGLATKDFCDGTFFRVDVISAANYSGALDSSLELRSVPMPFDSAVGCALRVVLFVIVVGVSRQATAPKTFGDVLVFRHVMFDLWSAFAFRFRRRAEICRVKFHQRGVFPLDSSLQDVEAAFGKVQNPLPYSPPFL